MFILNFDYKFQFPRLHSADIVPALKVWNTLYALGKKHCPGLPTIFPTDLGTQASL